MNRIWISTVNYTLVMLCPIWVPIFFIGAFLFSKEFKGARRGEGYLLNGL